MKVSVIGGAGKMGSWFANYFVKNGFKVYAYDIKPLSIADVTTSPSLHECVNDADVVILAVPVQKTAQLIQECAPSMKRGSLLAEISSVKSKTFGALKHSREDLTVLCIHPMFGPGADKLQDLKILMIPVRNAEYEHKAIRKLFPKMSIAPIKDARTHDKSIAAVLGLTYFINMAFADVIAREDLRELKKVGGTTFRIQTILSESIMTDEPELAKALLRDNPYARSYMLKYLSSAKRLREAKTIEFILRNIKRSLQKQTNLQESYNRLYGMLGNGKIT